MSIPIFQVDSFTNHAFAGNPAGVCLLDQPAEPEWMSAVAREMNLSETAFLVRVEDGYQLRWFTPAVEVDLCGHATLASAHILWESGCISPRAEVRFHTRSGLLTARLQDGWISMNFPAQPVQAVSAPPDLVASLKVSPCFVGKNKADYLLEVASEDEVRRVTPDYAALKTVPVRGVIVTSRSSTPEFDFVSRFFAPAVGVNEDPVTGSAHTCLTPYWSEKLGKTEMNAYQASARGGVLRVCYMGERVLISGQAVTVLRADLLG